MTEERFSASDLAPSDDERRAMRRSVVERAAATVALLSLGIWVGGMVALGACAAPFVFRMTPKPFSGDAMGAAFGRFDAIALGAAVALLGAEVARTWAAGRAARSVAARVRRFGAIVMACAAAYGGLALTPTIAAMHHDGVERNVGPAGDELERIHKRAEAVGKLEVILGALLIAMHVFTLRTGRFDDDDDLEADAPLPPGPS